MEIKDAGLPIHEDATAKIRPRIFLEGNFFVDLKPGTPSSPKLDDGDTIKVTRTATPVQLDQVLTALQCDTRQDLRDLLDGARAGARLQAERGRRRATPTRRRAARPRPSRSTTPTRTRRRRCAARARSTRRCSAPSPSATSRGCSKGTARTTGALIRNEGQLKDLITNFNTTMAAFASEQANLRTLDPPARADARERQRGARVAQRARSRRRARSRARSCPACARRPPTIDASFPWVDADAQAALARTSCAGSRRTSRPRRATSRGHRRLARAAAAGRPHVAAARATSSCRPATSSSTTSFDTGAANYKEFWWTMVGLAGESQNFDGNGSYVRFQPGGGADTVALGDRQLARPAQLVGSSPAPVLGVRPKFPGKRPPYNSSVPCHKSKIPTSTGRGARAGRVRRRHEDRDPQALARLRRDHRPDPDLGRRRGLHPRQPAPDAAGLGARSSARTSSSSRPSSRPPRRSPRARARPSTSPASRSARSRASSSKDGKALVTLRMEPKYGRVYKDATVLHAPEDRPQGHGRRARARHARRPGAWRTAT